MGIARRLGRPQIWVPALVALLILARVALHYGAEITIKGAFYDALGMGGAYAPRWHTSLLLIVLGVAVALALSLPLLFLRGKPRPFVVDPDVPAGNPADPRGDAAGRRLAAFGRRAERLARDPAGRLVRLALVGAWVATFAIITVAVAPRLAGARDRLLAWRHGRDFGVSDPIFRQDVGFYVFTEPALTRIAQIAAVGLGLATAAVVVVGLGLMVVERQRLGSHASAGIARRTATFGFALGGLFLLVIAWIMWLSRYALTRGGDGDLIGGAGAAVRDVDIPTRTVGAVFVAIMAIGLILLAVPAIRDRASRTTLATSMLGVAIAWTLVAVALVAIATPWWLVLLAAAVGALVWVRRVKARTPLARAGTPVVTWPAVAAASAVVVAILGPLGAALNDAIVLRGSQLQVERENLAATLEATRRATGIDRAATVDADYRSKGGVTRAAIERSPASIASLRFLDIPPTREACSRLQTINQFYACKDVDVDRYQIAGQRRTAFVIGREIDYEKLPDFQRRHFTYTHGYGLILAPVNEIDPDNGRPVFIGGDIPQRFRGDFVQPPLAQPSIYFGAQPGMPWAIVNTDQPEFDRTTNQRIEWTGDTGIDVGSGWRRLALTEFLGGLPYVGGGRRIWNATSGRPADADSDLLLYRDIVSRMRELAPFLSVDRDPYFAAADGHLWVMVNAYASTDRYPYARRFGDTSYARHTVTAVMDAYSGQTKLYVLDESEPITATWRAVYPELFTPASQIPAGVRAHLRYGEDLFDYQSAALGRYHVTDTDVYFNGDDAWAITEEAYGAGVTGERIESPARYTYAVLPGERAERFVAIRSYKPAARGRGIGFSGWLAASNEPDDFGKLTILRFPIGSDQALDSLDTFTSSVARDPRLSQEITTRANQVLRGNTIVVPVGEGLLYVQPLYLDSPGDSLPTLWQVIVSFGDGKVYAGDSFPEALASALGAVEEPAPGGGGGPAGPAPTLAQLVRRASDEFEAYRKAFGAGNDAEAARRLRAFRQALAQARRLADRRSP